MNNPAKRTVPGGYTLTGADARVIMGADPDAIAKLWRGKREGRADPEEKLLSDLARASIPANRAHFERRTGRRLMEGECRLRHPRLRWMGAILDGRLEDGALFEAKFAPVEIVTAEQAIALFQPTVQHDLWAAQAKAAVLSVVTADGRWFEARVESDPLYQHLLLTAEKRFLRCLECGYEPSPFLLEPAASELREVVDMSPSRDWEEAARLFRQTARAHAEHERARSRLAKLLPSGAFRGAAAGVAIERAPFGHIRFALLNGAAHA